MTVIYKNWKIDKNEFSYFEAFNLMDCDAYMKFSKEINDIKEEIDND